MDKRENVNAVDRYRPPDQRGLRTLLWKMVSSAEAKPLPPPVAPPDLARMSLLRRLWLYLLAIEYALAPGGQLRGLARWACRVIVAAVIVALGLAAVLACVAGVLAVVVFIVEQVVAMLECLLRALCLLVAIVIILGVLMGAAGGGKRRR